MLGKLRQKYETAMQPLGRRLGKLGAKPNAITTLSFIISILAAIAYTLKLPVMGAIGLLMSAFVDMLDGAVARATQSETPFGAVYDHVLDRYAEFIVLFGMGLAGFAGWEWIMFCLFGMVMASFTRAKAESVGKLRSCTVGIAERQEKLILIFIGSIAQSFIPNALLVTIIIIGVLSHITVLQRLLYTFKQARMSEIAV